MDDPTMKLFITLFISEVKVKLQSQRKTRRFKSQGQ